MSLAILVAFGFLCFLLISMMPFIQEDLKGSQIYTEITAPTTDMQPPLGGNVAAFFNSAQQYCIVVWDEN